MEAEKPVSRLLQLSEQEMTAPGVGGWGGSSEVSEAGTGWEYIFKVNRLGFADRFQRYKSRMTGGLAPELVTT